MDYWGHWAIAGPWTLCYLVFFVSAVFPWVNSELALLSFAAAAGSKASLLAITLLATAGQMTGKVALYWAARSGSAIVARRHSPMLERWQHRLQRTRVHPAVVVFISSMAGIPPFYLVTLLAGTLSVRLGWFVAAGTCGRLVRFGLLAFLPSIVLRLRAAV